MGIGSTKLNQVKLEISHKKCDDDIILLKVYKNDLQIVGKRYDGLFSLSKSHPEYKKYLCYIENGKILDIVYDFYSEITEIMNFNVNILTCQNIHEVNIYQIRQ
jgi:hypothetical protein